MAALPPNTQRPDFFHPNFNHDVFMIVFSVEGQGFKVDATRLVAHSEFLRTMIFENEGRLGIEKEGTLDNPIVLKGCTADVFANFLGWLNHNSWAPHRAEHSQQLLDILHVSHLYEILPGVEFATQELLQFDLHPAHRLRIARQYLLFDWIAAPIRTLLSSPLERYTLAHDEKDMLPFDLYQIIATTKEAISLERKRLANHPPFPPNSDNEPFCAQHDSCKRVWIEKWFFTMVRRIHNPTAPLPLAIVPDTLEAIDHHGMNPECKRSIITWLRNSCAQVQKEEAIIQGAITTVRGLFIV